MGLLAIKQLKNKVNITIHIGILIDQNLSMPKCEEVGFREGVQLTYIRYFIC